MKRKQRTSPRTFVRLKPSATTADPFLLFKAAQIPAVVLGVFAAFGPVRADKIFLKNGTTVDGTIIAQDRTSVRMNVAGSNQTIAKSEIVRIIFDDPGAAARQAAEEKKRRAAEEERLRQENERRRADEARAKNARDAEEKKRLDREKEASDRALKKDREEARSASEKSKEEQGALFSSDEDTELALFLTDTPVQGHTPRKYSGLILGASQLTGRYNSELEKKMGRERIASLLTISGLGVSYQEPWRNTGYRGGDFTIGWQELTWYAVLEARRLQSMPGFFGYSSLATTSPVIQGLLREQARLVPLKRDQGLALFAARIANIPFITRAYGIVGWSSFHAYGSYESDVNAELRIPAIGVTGYQGAHVFHGRGDLQAAGPVFGLDLRRTLPFGLEIRAKALASSMSGRWKERSQSAAQGGYLDQKFDSAGLSREDSKLTVAGVRSELGAYYTIFENVQAFFAWQHEKFQVGRTGVSKIKTGTDASDRDPVNIRSEYLLRIGGSSNRDLVQGFRLGIEAKIDF